MPYAAASDVATRLGRTLTTEETSLVSARRGGSREADRNEDSSGVGSPRSRPGSRQTWLTRKTLSGWSPT